MNRENEFLAKRSDYLLNCSYLPIITIDNKNYAINVNLRKLLKLEKFNKSDF